MKTNLVLKEIEFPRAHLIRHANKLGLDGWKVVEVTEKLHLHEKEREFIFEVENMMKVEI